jgi:hypothetical protein
VRQAIGAQKKGAETRLPTEKHRRQAANYNGGVGGAPSRSFERSTIDRQQTLKGLRYIPVTKSMKNLPLVLASLFPLYAMSQEAHEFQIETISGNQIAWSCEGEGSPTIVLVAGMGLDAHASFSRIYHNYDGAGRICMYDRAGMGESTLHDREPRRSRWCFSHGEHR